jgi:hypothetical protein
MRRILTIAGLSLAGLAPLPAGAQESEPLGVPTAEALNEVAAQIPEQAWYPPGYHDIRVAAADDYAAAEAARIANFIATTGEPESAYFGSYAQVNLGDCGGEDYGLSGEDNPAFESYVFLANDMAQFRDRLERAGYPASILDPALLAYERWRIAEILVDESGRDASEVDFAEEYGVANHNSDTYALKVLMTELNAARTGANAALPEVIMADGCGGEGPPVIVRTAPGNAQVWMISAFAFRVCTRRQSDPWDKFACRWNEVETGAESSLNGRYVYEVSWPDGTSRRGTREIRGDYATFEPTTVTFRKSGS